MRSRSDTSSIALSASGTNKTSLHPAIRTLKSHVLEFRSSDSLVIGGRNRNVLLAHFGENPVIPPIDCNVGTIGSATFACFLD